MKFILPRRVKKHVIDYMQNQEQEDVLLRIEQFDDDMSPVGESLRNMLTSDIAIAVFPDGRLMKCPIAFQASGRIYLNPAATEYTYEVPSNKYLGD